VRAIFLQLDAPAGAPKPAIVRGHFATMRRLTTAPNLAIAVLWADMLRQGGVACSVQRAYTSSIAGEIPPDQALPEVWIADADEYEAARQLLHELRHPPARHWVCRGCHERIDGPFEQCWNCGSPMPAL
jgi:hypothetical protein